MIVFFYNIPHINVSELRKGNHYFLLIVIVGSLEQEGVVKAREYKFNGLGGSNYVETSLSVGLTSMFGQKSSSPAVPCGDRFNNSCKRLKSSISSQPLFLKPCSNDKSSDFKPVEHGMEYLDLELRLGKQQQVK